MKVYYDKQKQCFYNSDIHPSIQSNDTVVEITAEQHSALLTALNSGCIIFDDLTYSEPKPSQFHNWDGSAWIEDIEAKTEYVKSVNAEIIKPLKIEALNEINILKYENDNADKLAEWEAYYAALKAIDISVEEIKLPKKPS